MSPAATASTYGEPVVWCMERPRIHLVHVVVSWLITALALWLAALWLPGVHVTDRRAALWMAAVVGVLNALLPPVIAAVRLPYTVALDFVLVLLLNAAVLQAGSGLLGGAYHIDNFGWALLTALVVAAVTVVLQVVIGSNDDDTYTIRVVQRVARRQRGQHHTDVPGILFLEIDGLALPVLRHAMRDGSAPTLARWMADGRHRLMEWETDLSSQTGASQAGILLGSNDDIPAFRWVEKESATVMSFSSAGDCVAVEQRLGTARGLLADGGSSRGNLLSGGADEVILTVSRIEAEKHSNPGYRAFFANGFNVTRTLVLFTWEIALELTSAARQRRRDVRPRGHRGGIYPVLRAFMTVLVRDLIVYGVLTDMMRGTPAVYATFSSYDEVAHHSGLERADTMEALRKLDQQFARIDRARRYAARPYHIVVLSDHGQTQGATFKQRNGYGLAELVQTSLADIAVQRMAEGDEQPAMMGHAIGEATGKRKQPRASSKDVSGQRAIVLGSGNLGLIYLMEQRTRLTLEDLERLHPRLVPALRAHPHIGWVMVRSSELGPVVLGRHGSRRLADGRVDGEDPLIPFSPNAAAHLLRADGFRHAPDLMVGSFYDPELDEGCAFEELISFHGGIGGPQTRPFILAPRELPPPAAPLVGAARVGELFKGWRDALQGGAAVEVASTAVPRTEAQPVGG